MHKFTFISAMMLTLSCIGLTACKQQETPASAAAVTQKPENTKPADTQKVQNEKSPEVSAFASLFGGKEEAKPTPLSLGEFKIIDVSLGTTVDSDNVVDKPKAVFKSSDKIYASVMSIGKHPGLKIQARWTAPDGRLVAKTEQAIVPTTAMVSTFSIDHDKAWPLGAYTLEISLNEQVQKTTSFEIR
jgi:hypothetical protein